MWRLLPGLLLLGGGSVPAGTDGPAPGADAALPTHRADIVWIPGGWFLRGSDEGDILHAVEMCREGGAEVAFLCRADLFVDEAPRDRVWVSGYGIDRTEVTFRAFRRCVAANACAPSRINTGSEESARRLARDDHPVAGITWGEARAFCEWAGGRLPSEAEWERAARGHDGRRYPWGNYYNPRLANHGRATPTLEGLFVGRPDDADGFRWVAPVGSYPGARSPYGLLDMAGNVWEWTEDLYDAEAYVDTTRVDPTGPDTSGGYRVRRGGSWKDAPFALRVAHRSGVAEGAATSDTGFRCAYDRR